MYIYIYIERERERKRGGKGHTHSLLLIYSLREEHWIHGYQRARSGLLFFAAPLDSFAMAGRVQHILHYIIHGRRKGNSDVQQFGVVEGLSEGRGGGMRVLARGELWAGDAALHHEGGTICKTRERDDEDKI